MSTQSYGLVATGKIHFAIFSEVVLPVDNIEWKPGVDLADADHIAH